LATRLKELGLITRLPKLSVIQAEGANPFFRSVHEYAGNKLIPMEAETLATAIRIGNPASWKKALRVVQASGGAVEQVSEIEMTLAKAEIGSDGVGCEPASAVTLAGLKKLVKQGFVKRNESVVLILTGHVLKDPEFTLKFHRGDLFAATQHESDASVLAKQQRAPLVLDASVEEVVRALDRVESENKQ
jgi:threonine synthase